MSTRFDVIGPTGTVPGKPFAVFDHERGHVALAGDPDGPRTGPLAYFATRRDARAWIRTHAPDARPMG